jgi:hypothetical protein
MSVLARIPKSSIRVLAIVVESEAKNREVRESGSMAQPSTTSGTLSLVRGPDLLIRKSQSGVPIGPRSGRPSQVCRYPSKCGVNCYDWLAGWLQFAI